MYCLKDIHNDKQTGIIHAFVQLCDNMDKINNPQDTLNEPTVQYIYHLKNIVTYITNHYTSKMPQQTTILEIPADLEGTIFEIFFKAHNKSGETKNDCLWGKAKKSKEFLESNCRVINI